MNAVRTIVRVAVATALAFATAHADSADFSHYYCWMEGAQVVPPSGLGSMGGGCFLLDAGVLSYEINLKEPLDGQIEATIRGPAARGENAPVLFTLAPFVLNFDSQGMLGPLTPAQIDDLNAGLWYVEVQTDTYPDGALRGQIGEILANPNPCTLPVDTSTWGAVKSLYR